MTLDIGQAIENGVNRTLKRNSGILIGIFSVLTLLTSVFSDSMVSKLVASGAIDLPNQAGVNTAAPLAFNLPASVSGILLTVATLLSTVVTIAAVRVFVGDETETIPSDYFTDRVVFTVANLIVGGIVFALAVTIGLAALIAPGIFLLSALYFWNFYVIDEGQNLVEAMKSSWRDTEGNRLRTLGLLILVVIATSIFGLIGGLVLGFAGSLVAGSAGSAVLGTIVSAVVTVFTLATFSDAYTQLKE